VLESDSLPDSIRYKLKNKIVLSGFSEGRLFTSTGKFMVFANQFFMFWLFSTPAGEERA